METYPFLNNGSNASFFSEKLATQLGLSGRSIPLTNMEREKSRSTSQVGSLQVMDLEVKNAVELPYVLIRPRLPNAPWKSCKKMPFCKMATTQSRSHGRTTHPVSRIIEALPNTGSVQDMRRNDTASRDDLLQKEYVKTAQTIGVPRKTLTFPTMLCLTQTSQSG